MTPDRYVTIISSSTIGNIYFVCFDFLIMFIVISGQVRDCDSVQCPEIEGLTDIWSWQAFFGVIDHVHPVTDRVLLLADNICSFFIMFNYLQIGNIWGHILMTCFLGGMHLGWVQEGFSIVYTIFCHTIIFNNSSCYSSRNKRNVNLCIWLKV